MRIFLLFLTGIIIELLFPIISDYEYRILNEYEFVIRNHQYVYGFVFPVIFAILTEIFIRININYRKK